MVKRFVTISFLLVFFCVAVYFYIGENIGTTTTPLEEVDSLNEKVKMKITSPTFTNNQMIPAKYTCDGEDVSPPLNFENIPEGTKSLALVVDDPDAPSGTWVHWVLFNISPEEKGVQEGAVPSGASQGITDFGKMQYGGPCPPSDTHRYFFKLYALDTALGLQEGVSKEELIKGMEGHLLKSAELVGLYSR